MFFDWTLSTAVEAEYGPKPVMYAAEALERDMAEALSATGEKNRILTVKDDALGEEEWRVRVSPEEITVYCGGPLGGAYALYFLGEKYLGVLPLNWWYGKKPPRREKASVPEGTYFSAPFATRWRGWFINDEVLLDGWSSTPAQRAGVWKRAFEALLRLGGNLVIAGTDRQYDGELIDRTASEMGLTLTQHHSEMLGAPMFGRRYPSLEASYGKYPDKFEALWREGIRKNAGRKVIWTVGFRGQGDHAFWDDDPSVKTDRDRGAFVSAVIARQMALVREKQKDAVFCVYLYGEIMGLCRGGYLDIPDEVIRIYSDNGFGKMLSRRQGLEPGRTDAMPGDGEAGRKGIYFHAGFYDLQAANHITMLQVPLDMTVRELETVLEKGAGVMWIINSGSIRPHLFVLDLIASLWRSGKADPAAEAERHAREYFGDASAGRLLLEYGEASVSYGPHEDDRAGDQFYHFPVREMCHALCRGDKYVERLLWVAPEKDFRAQAVRMAAIARPGIGSFGALEKKCREEAERLEGPGRAALSDSLLTAVILHRTGCEGLYAFSQACMHYLDGDDLQAFLWTDKALRAQREALSAMEKAEHGMFAHFYRNDCFTNVALTAQLMEGMRSFFRIRGDGPTQYLWERTYLIPAAETRITLQSHITRQLNDEELARGLRDEITPVPAETKR